VSELRRRVTELEAEVLSLRRAAAADSSHPSEIPAVLRGVNLLDSIDDGFLALDARWRFTFVSRNAERLLRRPAEALLNKVIWEEFPELVGTATERAYRRVMEQRVPGESEEYYPPLAAWFQGRYFPAPEGSIFVFFTNITERKTAEAALRWSEERWRALANAMPQFVWVARSLGDTLFINDYWFEYTGLPRGDFSLASWSQVLHPSDLPTIQAMWENAVATGTERRFEYRVRRASDGTWRWHLGFHRPERNSDGSVARWVGTAFEIHDRKAAEEALRRSEERFRAIVDTTPECVKLVGADGRLLLINPAGLAMVGVEGTENLVGCSIYDRLAPEDRDRYRIFHESICRGEKGTLEFDIIGPDGERRHMESHAAPLREPDGTVAQLAITRDITHRKRGEQA